MRGFANLIVFLRPSAPPVSSTPSSAPFDKSRRVKIRRSIVVFVSVLLASVLTRDDVSGKKDREVFCGRVLILV